MYQNAVAKFDKKTEKFQMWTTPKEGTPTGASSAISQSKHSIDNKCGSRTLMLATSTGSI